MTQIFKSLRFEAIEFLRHPGYMISTLLFPGLFFVVFAAPNIEDRDSALKFASSFMAFGILGVVFFQYTISLIEQKSSGWESLRRTLPISQFQRHCVSMLLFVIFGCLTGLLVFILAALTTPIEVSVLKVLTLLAAGMVFSLPFLLLGGGIAYRLNPLSALPVMNMIYLLLSFSGGLWLPPEALPVWLAQFSNLIPTRHYAEILWAIGAGDRLPIESLLYLGVMTLICAPVLYFSGRNFETQNYR